MRAKLDRQKMFALPRERGSAAQLSFLQNRNGYQFPRFLTPEQVAQFVNHAMSST
jgi:hypothetical protein